jgi:hypothetical protein
MFLHVERMRIEIASNHTLARKYLCHGLAEHVCNNAQENAGHIDCLWLEVEDLLKHGCKDRQSKSSWSNVSITMLEISRHTHKKNMRNVHGLSVGSSSTLRT